MIGVFDSGYGGLTVFSEIRKRLPQYDYLYLGDNARTPYGSRSFEVVYAYTWQAVDFLFRQGCRLVILACNTASAKALRQIQQCNLPRVWAEDGNTHRRVLGVIRPTVEVVGRYTHTRHIGIFATPGTVASNSYPIELGHLYPDLHVTQQSCPLWVPLIEANEHQNEGADWFVEKYVRQLMHSDPLIDTAILGCTHYPLLKNKIQEHIGKDVQLISQGAIVARSLEDYLLRHPEVEQQCQKGGTEQYLTTESVEKFAASAGVFLSAPVTATHIELE